MRIISYSSFLCGLTNQQFTHCKNNYMFHLFSLVLLIEYFSLKIARTAEKLLWECRNLCITETSVMPNSVNNECNGFIFFTWYPLHSKHLRIFTQINIYLILTRQGPCPVHILSCQSWDAFQNQSSSDAWTTVADEEKGLILYKTQVFPFKQFTAWTNSRTEQKLILPHVDMAHRAWKDLS